MKPHALFCLLVCGPLGAVADEAGLAKKDQQQLQGDWVAVAGEYSRAKFDRELAGIRVNFRGAGLTLRIGGDTLEADYHLDPSRQPHWIDLLPAGGAGSGKKLLGIYALAGDKLKLCFAEASQPRPTEFRAEGQPGVRTLLVLRRASP